MEKYLTVDEISTMLRVLPITVRVWIRRGVLSAVKLPGGGWRVRPEDVEAMLQQPARTE